MLCSSSSCGAQLLELFFEEFHFPAAYIPSTAMLGAFCYGRSTALVIDMGASHTTISPVVDGYVLRKAVVSTSRGGDFMDSLISDTLASRGVQVFPWFQKPGFSQRPISVTPSFVKFHRGDVLRDIKQWMCFLSPYSKQDDDNNASRATVNSRIQYLPSYELPDGTTVVAYEELCLAPDVLFKKSRTRAPASALTKAPSTGQSSSADSSRPGGIIPAALINGLPAHAQPLDIDYSADPLHELVYASIAKCDIDCRKELLSNIVLVGGGSLLDGLPARLTSELGAMVPSHMKVSLYKFAF
jgi:actin-like protein 6A